MKLSGLFDAAVSNAHSMLREREREKNTHFLRGQRVSTVKEERMKNIERTKKQKMCAAECPDAAARVTAPATSPSCNQPSPRSQLGFCSASRFQMDGGVFWPGCCSRSDAQQINQGKSKQVCLIKLPWMRICEAVLQ